MTRPLDMRKHQRFEVDEASATLFREGFLLKLGIGRGSKARAAVDLSEGGIRLAVTERLQPGTRVRIRIELEKYKEVIEATGMIRWCRQYAGKADEYIIGVMFEKLSPQEIRKIGLMRECMTSVQYKVMRETRRHQKRSELDPPK